jgi:dTDP-4-dehydrorhamnose 3,5-epimerase
MKITPLEIEGAWVAEAPLWEDERGWFREWFKISDIESVIDRKFNVEQANVSSSRINTIRGIHYSLAAKGQAKWITCISGSIRDIVVDIRPKSETFGKWIAIELSGNSGKSVFYEEGLGHGFISLAENSTITYLETSTYSPKDEYCINPFDDVLNIDWKVSANECILSEKDRKAPGLNERLRQGKLPEKIINEIKT